MAPISEASSGVRSLIWTAVMSPSSSFSTTSASTTRMRSRSRSRSSSATIVPWKSGSAKPSTIIWTGPMAPLVSLIVAFSTFCFWASNSAWVRTPWSRRPLRLVSSATMSVPPAAGAAGAGGGGAYCGCAGCCWACRSLICSFWYCSLAWASADFLPAWWAAAATPPTTAARRSGLLRRIISGLSSGSTWLAAGCPIRHVGTYRVLCVHGTHRLVGFGIDLQVPYPDPPLVGPTVVLRPFRATDFAAGVGARSRSGIGPVGARAAGRRRSERWPRTTRRAGSKACCSTW